MLWSGIVGVLPVLLWRKRREEPGGFIPQSQGVLRPGVHRLESPLSGRSSTKGGRGPSLELCRHLRGPLLGVRPSRSTLLATSSLADCRLRNVSTL